MLLVLVGALGAVDVGCWIKNELKHYIFTHVAPEITPYSENNYYSVFIIAQFLLNEYSFILSLLILYCLMFENMQSNWGLGSLDLKVIEL